MSILDGYFTIKILDDGVYVEINAPGEGGKKVQLSDIEQGLLKQGIKKYDNEIIKDALNDLVDKVTVKVADYNNNDSEELPFDIKVSDDKLKVYLIFNNKCDVSISSIIDKLNELGIKANVNREILNSCISEKNIYKQYIIAEGTPPIHPTQSIIKYNFKTDKEFKPEIDEKGNVNFHKLHIINNVKKGQLLATLIPGKQGKSGYDVYGKEIKPKKIKPVRLRMGKNVEISEDGLKLYAKIDGLVKLEGNKVVVNNTLDITGNVGSSTGDIEFEGSIVISGNITTGFKVVAKGDIEVLGVVEAAFVEAGGDIVVHRGIQGMNKCNIFAAGNINAKYIENADVVAGGSIYSEAILHSNVSAKKEIVVEGKKGMITGGAVRAGMYIEANILGSHMGTVTIVNVGIDPALWEEYTNLKTDLPKLYEELNKLDQIITLLNKRKEIKGVLDDKKKEVYISATRNKIFLNNKINMNKKRIAELKELVDLRNDGKLKVLNKVYPGVRINIGDAKKFIRDELERVTMLKDGADIKVISL